MDKMLRLSACAVALLVAAVASAQTDTGETTPPSPPTTTTTIAPLSPGQARVAAKVAAPFASIAGSQENAVALATALRTGTTATLSYGTGDQNATQTIVPPTKPMGWGNVKHALALAQYSLNQAGITNPTAAELQAALLGGSITGADGNAVTLTGVLGQRASGLGWGQIAKGLGTTMGAVNRGVNTASMTPPQSTAPVPETGGVEPKPTSAESMSTAAGAARVTSSRGLVTAGGTQAGTGHASKGITTASGTAPRGTSGVVKADSTSGPGHGTARGHGIVNAAGGSAASVAAVGSRGGASAATTTSGVVTANPGQGHGGGNGHAKGKGG